MPEIAHPPDDKTDDKTFAWWGSDGVKHEGPIRYQILLPGQVLIPLDWCVPFDEGDSNA